MALPDWITTLFLKAAIGAAIIALIAAVGWLSTRLRPPRADNHVRIGSFVTGAGLVATGVGAWLTWVLTNHERLLRPDQFWGFLAIWALFAFGGVYLLLIETRFAVIHDESGLRWRGRFSGWRKARWADIVDSQYSGWRHAILFDLADGTRIEISEYSDGLESLTEAAFQAGVPGVMDSTELSDPRGL